MPNILQLTVENPAQILNAGAFGAGALIRLQSGAAEAGPFSDVSGTGSTPTTLVVDPTRFYDAYDPNGTSATWYRTRFENAGGTRVSDWLPAFQVGDETAGLICSVEDVEQDLGSTQSANDRESILEKIRQVTVALEGYCGRWFLPRPLSGETTLVLSPGYDGTRLLRDGRTILFPRGVRSLSAFGYATTDQPTVGGAYTALTAAQYALVPATEDGWPSTRVILLDTTGAVLVGGINRITWTGSFGFASAPADLQGVGVRAVIRRWLGKARAAPTVSLGPSGSMLLRDMSPDDAAIVERYRVIPV
ncbi:MAG TPA: hypothetical protein VGQ89_09820 [Candidatus Limnocylindrales bacterium]|nr:hypothetical protein [Candidatus Limnocylindrales bacterium]